MKSKILTHHTRSLWRGNLLLSNDLITNRLTYRVSVVQSKIQEMNEELNQETVKNNDINSQISDLQFSMREPNLDLEGAQRELNSLRDPREIFCSRLSDREQDVVKAYRWIDANRQRFHGECYGPIGMEIRVWKSLPATFTSPFLPSGEEISWG